MKRVKFDIDEEDSITGVKTISLVDEPAIESGFVAFSKDNIVELKIEGYKQIVAGLALIPDKEILRTAGDGEKYLAYFTADSIERIRNKFHKELLTDRVNVDHDQNYYIPAFLIESFIIDSEERLADVKNKGIAEATMGAWFVAYKIEDEQTFKRVLAGELRGFSVEIFVNKMFKKTNEEPKPEIKPATKHRSIFERRLKLKNSINKIQNQ